MRLRPSLALTASVGAAGLILAPAATAAAATPDDSVAYLAGQLRAGGDRLTVESDGQSYDDLGLTIDAVLAMSAAGSGGEASAAATDYVVANAGSYYGYGEDVYAAATGKLLTFASARGLDPRSVGGVDLVNQLQSLEADSGQFVDQSEWGDYSNTLGQSFGLIGLKRAGVNPSTASVDFLLAQQCDDGGFSLEFVEGCLSDPDATSMAVQALAAIGGQDEAVQDAADYLQGRQGQDGGVGGGATTEGTNSNSTGLAAVALGLAGRADARAQALGYLDSLTFACQTPALTGAVAYNRADFDAARHQGAQAQPDGTITRSTTQALLGRTTESYATISIAGQTAATPTVECDDASSGDDGTPTDEPTTSTPTNEPTTGTGTDDSVTTPEIPAVVQTDGALSARAWPLALAAGLSGAALVVLRRRAAQQR